MDIQSTLTFVDDSKELLHLIQLLMESQTDVKCLCFSSFAEVQARSKDVLNSSVAILDINLGEGQPDGVAIYEWLKKSDYKSPIYFFTGHAKESPQVKRAQKTGAVVLEKPMTPDELVRILKEAISDGRKQRE